MYGVCKNISVSMFANASLQRTDVNGNKTELGCLYEANAPESTPIHLSDGTRLSYLEDGDEVILEAWCLNESGQKLGFGQCRGKLLHAYA